MRCPEEIEETLLQILSFALINVRAFSSMNEDAKRCGIEADHVHNLPGLIASYSSSGLRYYVNIFVSEYVRLVGADSGTAKMFKPHWEQLGKYLEIHSEG